MVNQYFKPKTLAEAIELLRADPKALALAGGTYLLTSQFHDARRTLVSLSDLLPNNIEWNVKTLYIGAQATFQDLMDSPFCPPVIKSAAAGMANRNIRNRASVGGNIGADKSCASLPPVFIAGDARYLLVGGTAVAAESWHGAAHHRNDEIIEAVEIDFPDDRFFSYGKYSRTSCDLAVITCAVSATRATDGGFENLRIAMGGLSLHPRLFHETESLLPLADVRGSADFKRRRAAILLADVMATLGRQV